MAPPERKLPLGHVRAFTDWGESYSGSRGHTKERDWVLPLIIGAAVFGYIGVTSGNDNNATASQHPVGAPQPPSSPSAPETGGGRDNWLWTTYSGAYSGEHHSPISNPPVGDHVNGASKIHIATVGQVGYSVFGAPTISCQEFVNVLRSHHSPAASVGAEMWYKAYLDGVNPAFILGMFRAESNYGTGYNGNSPLSAAQENLGNQRINWGLDNHAPGFKEYNGWMDFSNWGARGWTVSTAYVDGNLWWEYNTFLPSQHRPRDLWNILQVWDPGMGDLNNVLDTMRQESGR